MFNPFSFHVQRWSSVRPFVCLQMSISLPVCLSDVTERRGAMRTMRKAFAVMLIGIQKNDRKTKRQTENKKNEERKPDCNIRTAELRIPAASRSFIFHQQPVSLTVFFWFLFFGSNSAIKNKLFIL